MNIKKKSKAERRKVQDRVIWLPVKLSEIYLMDDRLFELAVERAEYLHYLESKELLTHDGGRG